MVISINHFFFLGLHWIYRIYFDRFLLDTINVKIYKNKVVRIQRILILEKWILKIINIVNMKKIQNIIKKFNKIILFLKIYFINNFTNLKFTSFSFWAQNLAAFKKKWLQFTSYITGTLLRSHFEISWGKFKN